MEEVLPSRLHHGISLHLKALPVATLSCTQNVRLLAISP